MADSVVEKNGAQLGGIVAVAVIVALALACGLVAAIGVSSSAHDGQGVTVAAVTDAPASTVAAPTAPGGDAPSPQVTTPASTALSAARLTAMLLPSGSVGDGANVVGGAPAGYTLQQYRAGYESPMMPSACANAKGLMVFTDVDHVGADGWTIETIYRVDDLRLDGSSLHGSQQIRQYATELDAQAFIDRQRNWFASCPDVEYDFPGGTTLFSGSVFADTGDRLLTSASDDSAGALSGEFDGWVRVGTVVYGAYLLGESTTTTEQLQRAGSAVIDAAQQRLEQRG